MGVLAVVLSVLPLLWPALPPLIDLPGHMARYHIALSLPDSPMLQRYYDFQWVLVGNLGVDLLMLPMGHLLGVENGAKVAVIFIVAFSAAGMLWLAHEAHGRLPASTLLALPLIYNFAFHFGFVNYCLSLAWVLLALAAWIRLETSVRRSLRALLFVAVASAVWLTHAIGWALLCVCCAAVEAVLRWRRGERAGAWVLSVGLACLPMLAPLLIQRMVVPSESAHTMGSFLSTTQLLTWSQSLLRDRWQVLDLASVAGLGLVVGLAALRVAGLRLAPTLALPGAIVLAMFLFGPARVDEASHVNGRLLVLAAMLLVLAVRTDGLRPHLQRLCAWAALAFLLLRITCGTVSYAYFDQLHQEQLQALNRLPRGGAVASFSPYSFGKGTWYDPRTHHLPDLAVVRRDAFTNSGWNLKGLHLLKMHYPAAGEFGHDPSQVVFPATVKAPAGSPLTLEGKLNRFPYAAFDHVWLLDIPPQHWPQRPELRRVWSGTDAVLYQVVAP